MALSMSTRQMIRQIRSKYKDPITGKPLFENDESVISFSIEWLHRELIKRR
jgi:hypothetical protein